ncbi:TraB/GumN family protein [Neiella marina]|uniref:TraB/GumN family protein n=1 Tax=Neiella holothuriorum TaxID=2870530 RepID=A0ABS7EIE8_9GAMM|nr:TraB/GumN family protein [Neiella holothuriorum]MBW8192126.1 TraB/GumN family protein [Neiella holothuriorum]
MLLFSRLNHFRSVVLIIALVTGIGRASASGAAPALYLAEKGALQIYLLGSIHAGRDNFYPLADHIQQAFSNSDELLLELAPNQMTPELLQQAMLKYGVLAKPKPLPQRMSAELYQHVEKVMTDARLPAHQLIFMRDWAVLIQLTMATIKQMGLVAEQGIDQHFAQRAERAGMPIRGLETLDLQFSILASMDEVGPEVMYQDFVNELPFAQQWLLALESAWRHGDPNTLNRLYQEYDARQDQAEFLHRMNRDRNVKWRDQLVKLNADKTYMVVVGDMHIHANDSVLDYLEQAGFRISKQLHVAAKTRVAAPIESPTTH